LEYEKKPLVTNASDEQQVSAASKKVKFTREQELLDIKAVMNTFEGQRFIWRILSKCKAFGSVWEASAKIHYNSGMQDIGHFLMAEIVEADEQALFKIMKQNLKGEK
jgi:hypothetical protein